MAKVAIVTGAGTGVGRAAALALMKAGFSVALAGRRKEPLEAVLKEGGGNGIAVPTDVKDIDAIRKLFATVKEKYGRLDVIFNNAGMGAPPVPFEELPVEKWKEVVDTNLTALFVCSQATLGALVVISKLHPIVNTAHVVNGALVLGTSVVLALRAYRAAAPRTQKSGAPSRSPRSLDSLHGLGGVR